MSSALTGASQAGASSDPALDATMRSEAARAHHAGFSVHQLQSEYWTMRQLEGMGPVRWWLEQDEDNDEFLCI